MWSTFSTETFFFNPFNSFLRFTFGDLNNFASQYLFPIVSLPHPLEPGWSVSFANIYCKNNIKKLDRFTTQSISFSF